MLSEETMAPDEEFIEQRDGGVAPGDVIAEAATERKQENGEAMVEPKIAIESDKLDDKYDMNHMLDFFPVTREELRHVLEGYERYSTATHDKYDEGPSTTFVDLFQSAQLQAETVTGNANKTEEEPEAVDFLMRRKLVEAEFLPETPLILQKSIDNVFLLGSGNDDSPLYKFVEAVVTLLGRRSSRSLLTVVYQVAADERRSESEESNMASPDAIIHLVYRFVLGSFCLRWGQPSLRRMHPKPWVQSLAQRSTSGKVSLPVLIDWVQTVAPQIDKTVSTYFHYAIFGTSHPFMSTHPSLQFPRVIANGKSALWTFPYQGVPASLCVLSTTLGGPWVQLYSSDLDGISFRAMQQALLSYQGPPTVLIIQTTAGDAFGYYTNCPWKESKRWYGQHEATESFLFGLKPSLQYYAPIGGEKTFYQFLSNPVYAHPTDLNGLAIGGINDMTPRLHITTNFEHCKAGTMDGVYASGPLLSDGELFFDIDLVEIYAVNCTAEEFEKGIAMGRANAAVREGTRLKAAQVDRTQFLEDFQTGQYMNQLFVHRDQIRGRHSFIAHEDGSSGYFVESKAPSVRRLQVEDEDK
ncbi:MAG: hypothetical protein SGILL_000785 [Bacillariaceae sp.]